MAGARARKPLEGHGHGEGPIGAPGAGEEIRRSGRRIGDVGGRARGLLLLLLLRRRRRRRLLPRVASLWPPPFASTTAAWTGGRGFPLSTPLSPSLLHLLARVASRVLVGRVRREGGGERLERGRFLSPIQPPRRTYRPLSNPVFFGAVRVRDPPTHPAAVVPCPARPPSLHSLYGHPRGPHPRCASLVASPWTTPVQDGRADIE